MKSRWIKLCSILLVLTMLINMLPVHALALDSEDRGSASILFTPWKPRPMIRLWAVSGCMSVHSPTVPATTDDTAPICTSRLCQQSPVEVRLWTHS